MTGVFEALDEIDVGGIRTIVGNATQIFNNIDSLLTTQTSNIGKKKSVFHYSVLNETENNFLLFFVISDISSVLNESREAIQNVIGGVQNTIDNVREMRS